MTRLIEYRPKRFHGASEVRITQANTILAEYAAMGYDLTLRQLYYQFVARDLLPNSDRSYAQLGLLISEARLAGRVPWDLIVDRTRRPRRLSTWDTPMDILASAAASYREDLWDDQPVHVEVWIEKDALIGVLEPIAERERVTCFSCRGYVSQSAMWEAAQRLGRAHQAGKTVQLFHLGDHDPSGLDMTRDIEERLRLFLAVDEGPDVDLTVTRLGLTRAQVRRYRPPDNPAKLSDARARDYVAQFGPKSWELDALAPPVLDALIADAVAAVRDDARWARAATRETTARAALARLPAAWPTLKLPGRSGR